MIKYHFSKEKKHILLAIDSIAGRGAEKVVLNLGEAFLKLKHQVSIVIYEDIVDFKINSRINFYNLKPLRHEGSRIFSRLTDRKNANLMQTLLNHIEVLHGHIDLILSALPRIDRILSRIKDNRIYHVIHNPLSLQNGIRKNNWRKKLSRIWHMKRIYDGRQIICVSTGIGEDLIKYVKVRPAFLKTIYNPFHFDEIKKFANEKLKFPSKIIANDYLLHIGALTLQQKRQDILIKAFALSGLTCNLVLLGKGKDEKKIRALIKSHGVSDRVFLAGFQANPYPWIKHARMLVLSSDYEGFGNVLVEAMALNTPALSTNCPTGPSEIFSERMQDCLVPNGNIQALAEKMRQFYKTPPRIDKKNLKRFDANIIAKEYLKLIQ
jgi:glycosyltransferase involved in cell wall biosynthesis